MNLKTGGIAVSCGMLPPEETSDVVRYAMARVKTLEGELEVSGEHEGVTRVLGQLRGVRVDVDDRLTTLEAGPLAGAPVVEADAEGNQDVGLPQTDRRGDVAVHAGHS